jgi:lipoprotein NlpI
MSESIIQQAMREFIANRVSESVVEFDRALQLDAKKAPYLWQRGLSLYYVGRYEDAARQFALDVSVNPNDTGTCFQLRRVYLHGAQMCTS